MSSSFLEVCGCRRQIFLPPLEATHTHQEPSGLAKEGNVTVGQEDLGTSWWLGRIGSSDLSSSGVQGAHEFHQQKFSIRRRAMYFSLMFRDWGLPQQDPVCHGDALAGTQSPGVLSGALAVSFFTSDHAGPEGTNRWSLKYLR